jgi:hypothetical protein
MSETNEQVAKNTLKIAPAKGRPMLSWVGKRPLREIVAFPSQDVERFEASDGGALLGNADWSEWPKRYDRGGLLFHGDNKEVLGAVKKQVPVWLTRYRSVPNESRVGTAARLLGEENRGSAYGSRAAMPVCRLCGGYRTSRS